MSLRRILEFGGLAASVVLITFGAFALYLGVDARNTVRDSVRQENITFGTTDDPAVVQYAQQWAGEQVTTGEQARAFAQVMRAHALESSEGLTYAQMGRFLAADNPDDPAGTSDPEAALLNEQGEPVANSFRNTWVTQTALSTALNVSYMAEQLSLFSIMVGVALVLAGIGFGVLALAVLGGAFREREARAARALAGAGGPIPTS